MKTSHALLLASCLGLALALDCAHGRTLLQAASPSMEDGLQAADLSGCPAAPTDSVDPPEGSEMVWQITGTGERNYTCVGGKLEFAGEVADLALPRIDDGKLYYTPPVPEMMAGPVGYLVVDLTMRGAYYMDTTKVVTEGKGEREDARWPVAKMESRSMPCDYLVRMLTDGAPVPYSCGTAVEGGVYTSFYTAVYVCYACP